MIGLGLAILSTFVWLIVGLIVIGYTLFSLVDMGNDPQEDNRDAQEDQTVLRESETEM
jgi:hypothetical protein